ncbi:MAG: hypothetical protein ACM30I_09275 [Gemmatimonas sp.]
MSEQRPGGRKHSAGGELTSLPESEASATERAERLRQKAAELRAAADGMTDGPSRISLLCLAEDYEKLSDYATQRAELARRFHERMAG